MLKKIMIFGNGQFLRDNIENIKKQYEIDCILDNASRGEEEYEGIRVINPADVVWRNQKVLIMIKNFFDVYCQLREMGLKKEDIILGVNDFGITEKEKIIISNSRIVVEDDNFFVYFLNSDKKIRVFDWESLDKAQREVQREYFAKNEIVKNIRTFQTNPVSRDFGMERGTAIDRFFIDSFIANNKNVITGDVLEIGDNIYTLRYGTANKYSSHVLHVKGWGEKSFKGNLETGEGLENKKFDTVIITQTLMFLYDVEKAVKTIKNILKKDGTGLITVSGIAQVSRYDADRWGDYWRFNKASLEKIFFNVFGKDNTEIRQYGNVKLACAMLYGLCMEELDICDFDVVDYDYPLIFTIKVKKR